MLLKSGELINCRTPLRPRRKRRLIQSNLLYLRRSCLVGRRSHRNSFLDLQAGTVSYPTVSRTDLKAFVNFAAHYLDERYLVYDTQCTQQYPLTIVAQ